MAGMKFDWISDDNDLERLVNSLRNVERIALDTEFHRERTYYPRLALVQLAWAGGSAIVDPLACDVSHLGPLFDRTHLIVLHAAQQDLDVLAHAINVIPERIYDTQLAAGFLGYSTPSLSSLVQSELRISLPKGDRLTDWLRRPLSDAQLSYAASDVEHLLELELILNGRLIDRGRLDWALEACEELRSRRVGPGDPREAWLRQKDIRTLKPRTRGVLAAVAEWRERRAMASDIPPRQVLPDLALHGIAQREPSSLSELAQARGVDDRHVRGALGQEILEAVRAGLKEPRELPRSDGEELERHLRPAVTLVSAWISEVARTAEIDTALLATRGDIVSYLRRDPDARLGRGWRRQIVGSDLDDLLAGRKGLSFDGRGGLRLISSGS